MSANSKGSGETARQLLGKKRYSVQKSLPKRTTLKEELAQSRILALNHSA